MANPRVRFTIGKLMVAIAVVAGLFALPNGLGLIMSALAVPFGCVRGAQWLVFWRHRGLAAMSFWAAAVLTNVLAAFSCIAPNSYTLPAIFLGLLFIAVPMIAAFGTAWACLLGRETAVPRHIQEAAGISVFILAVLPVLTLWTLWPLHLAFRVSRPAMERVADQVAAGKTVGFPRWTGTYVIRGAAVDAVSGNVALMIDPDPGGPTGFVRAALGKNARGTACAIVGSNLDIDLGGRWSYREDD